MIIVKVNYVDHHIDNYQGGSGKSFQFSHSIEIPYETPTSQLKNYIHEKLLEHVAKQRPYHSQYDKINPAIQSIEIVY